MRPMSLAAARVDAELTQADVAKHLHVSKATIVAWERGTSEPKVGQFEALCHLYQRGIDEIILKRKSN